jgi:hypothetical protein
MRPLRWWLRTKGFSPRGNPLHTIKVTRRCLRALVLWKETWFLSKDPVLGALCRRIKLTTDASLTGWGAVMSGRPAQGLWQDHHLSWHINCLEMLAVFQALKHFLADLRGHHVLVQSNNTSVVSYINRQGGLRSRRLYKLARQVLLWSLGKLLSLAMYLPGYLNVVADSLSRQGPRPGEWRLHPRGGGAPLVEFRSRRGRPIRFQGDIALSSVVLHQSSSPSGVGRYGAAVAEVTSVRFSPDCSAIRSSGEGSPGRGQPTISSPVLAGQSMVCGPGFSPGRLSFGAPGQEGSTLSGGRHDISPLPRVMETVGLASEGAQLLDSGLSTEVVETILHSRAPSTRKLYAFEVKTFHFLVWRTPVGPS